MQKAAIISFLVLWMNKKQIQNCRVLCNLSQITSCVSILNPSTAFQYCTSLAKEMGSLTHSEDRDSEAAFHRHYGCDSELGTKCPLSNSLENVKRHSHTNTVSQSKCLLTSSTHTNTHKHSLCELDNHAEI